VTTMGAKWASVVETWVLCYNLGILISYVILLGDFLGSAVLCPPGTPVGLPHSHIVSTLELMIEIIGAML